MNVAVNGRFLSRRVSGVERYAQELLRCLEGRLRVIRPGGPARGLGGHAWEELVLPRQIHPDELLWSPANTGPLAVKNQVLTLHDISPLEYPEWYAPAFALWYRSFLPILVRRVKRVVVSSDYTRRKIIRRFSLQEQKVRLVPGGVDLQRFKPGMLPPVGLPPRYILFVGALQPRKNLGALLQAWETIRQDHPDVWLLVAGAPDVVFRRQSLPVDVERLRWLGYFSEQDLPGLYAGAQIFVMPSLEEGFGLPLLEAMACGTPVIASRAGSLPEVAGEAALLIDPNHPEKLIDALARCLADGDLRRSLTEKGLARAQDFGWARSAEAMWEVLQQ